MYIVYVVDYRGLKTKEDQEIAHEMWTPAIQSLVISKIKKIDPEFEGNLPVIEDLENAVNVGKRKVIIHLKVIICNIYNLLC